MLTVELCILIDKNSVIIKNNTSAEAFYLCDSILQRLLASELLVYLLVGISVVKSSLPPSEYEKSIKAVLLSLKIKSREVCVFKEYFSVLVAKNYSLPACHTLYPISRCNGRKIGAAGKRRVNVRTVSPVSLEH